MTSPASPSHDPARRVRLEFTVEPFVPNDPGPHVTGPIDAARRHASAVTEVGPFGTTVDAPADAIVDVVDDVVRTALANGATRLSLQISTQEESR